MHFWRVAFETIQAKKQDFSTNREITNINYRIKLIISTNITFKIAYLTKLIDEKEELLR